MSLPFSIIASRRLELPLKAARLRGIIVAAAHPEAAEQHQFHDFHGFHEDSRETDEFVLSASTTCVAGGDD